MKTLKINDHEYVIGDGWAETKYGDGVRFKAMPNYTDEDINRCKALGYETVEQMTEEHDLFHHLLAEARGWWHSNVIWDASHGVPVGPGGDDEERIVMLMARLRNGKFDDIVKEHEISP